MSVFSISLPGWVFCFLHAYLVSNLHEFALVKTSYFEEMTTIITLPINATYLFKVIFPSWYGKGVACSALLMLIFFYLQNTSIWCSYGLVGTSQDVRERSVGAPTCPHAPPPLNWPVTPLEHSWNVKPWTEVVTATPHEWAKEEEGYGGKAPIIPACLILRSLMAIASTPVTKKVLAPANLVIGQGCCSFLTSLAMGGFFIYRLRHGDFIVS